MKKGILLIAINSANYARMAANLAVSLRISNPDVKIAIITNLKEDAVDWGLFDKTIRTGETNPFKLKTEIYDLSPFEETLFLDVDAVLNPKKNIEDLFKLLGGFDFVNIELNRHKVEEDADLMWYNTQQVREQLKPEKGAELPRLNTSLIWYKKTEKNAAYFDEAKNQYLNPIKGHKKLGAFYNDECAFQCAGMLLKHYSQIKCFDPIYYHWNRDKNFKKFFLSFFFLGFGGANVTPRHETQYNMIVKSNGLKTDQKYYVMRNASKYLHNFKEFRRKI